MVTYDLSIADLVAWAQWRQATVESGAPERRRTRVVAAWLVGAAGYLLVSATLTIPWLVQQQLPLAGISEALALTLGLVGGWQEWRVGSGARWLERRRARNRARVALEQTSATRRLWLDDGGLWVAAKERETHLPWSQITEVIGTPDHYFIRIGTSAVHVLPRRVCDSADELVAQIRRKLAAG